MVYNKGSKPNRLTDAPALTTRIIARLRGFSSMKFPKHQYLIRMLAEDGGRNEVDVLGMGAEWEWILNISYIDKSLIRNYLCMNIAARAMGYAPEMRYCEVFQKRGGQYEYLGLYLLMESIKRGPNRVAISKYDPSYAETAYILRRDRYDDRGIILDTYGSIHNLAEEFLGVRYPGRNTITDKTVAFIERDISRFEKALYSNEVKEFIGYRDQIDIDSFVDYYVINEFFGSYDSGFHSYYMHKDLRERLKLGPLWDFDQAIDNNRPYVFEPEAAAMQTGVWFDRLVMDGLFSRRIRSRYRQLRRSILSDRYIGAFIDEAVAYMGDARIRDWNRWQYDNQEVLQRDKIEQVHPSLASNSRNFEEEIEHIRIILQQHGAWLDKHLGDVVMGNVITD